MELHHLLLLLLAPLLLLQPLTRRPLLHPRARQPPPASRLALLPPVPAFPAAVAHSALALLLQTGQVGQEAAVQAGAHGGLLAGFLAEEAAVGELAGLAGVGEGFAVLGAGVFGRAWCILFGVFYGDDFFFFAGIIDWIMDEVPSMMTLGGRVCREVSGCGRPLVCGCVSYSS